MQVHTFRAASLQEALQKVRQSLGPDASVLHTRERRRRLGLFSRTIIEVEATLDMPLASHHGDECQDARDMDASPHSGAALVRGEQPRASSKTQGVPSTTAQTPSVSPLVHSIPTTTTGPTSSAVPTSGAGREGDPPSKPSRLAREVRSRDSLSPAIVEVLSELLDGGVDPRLARELLREAGDSCSEGQAQDEWLIRGRLSQLVASKLSISGSIDLREGQQQVVAMVGPTGAGKTTSLAKIAAGFRFDLGCQIGLITLDTFRLGAVDQLLQYAELISAPLEVVSSPDQVTAALKRLRDCDLVLLDTAGRSPKDTEQLVVLRDFLRCAEPHSTQLVVSSTSSAAHVRETVNQFSILEPTNLLITKLDEAVAFGAWLSLLRDVHLPVSYLTTGQHVPQDIVVASARRLTSLLLGGTPQPAATP